MDYEERLPPPSLDGFVKALWTMRVGGEAAGWIDSTATPDGCIEIIHRVRGQSIWHRDQPAVFAAGMTTRPARLRLRGDAVFHAVRLWPWTWHLLGGPGARGFADDWIAIDPRAPLGRVADRLVAGTDVEHVISEALQEVERSVAVRRIGHAILASVSVADAVERTGMTHRSLQRWCRKYVGLPLRTYLRLLRFQDTLGDVVAGARTLAGTAAKRGYADQPHMARAFRDFAGTCATAASSASTGPFLGRRKARRRRGGTVREGQVEPVRTE